MMKATPQGGDTGPAAETRRKALWGAMLAAVALTPALAGSAGSRLALAAPDGGARPQPAPPPRLTAPPAPRSTAPRTLQDVQWTPNEQTGLNFLKWGLGKFTDGWSDGPFDLVMGLVSGDTSDTQQILNQLQQIATELQAVDQALAQLQQGITQLENQIFAQSLQQELQVYETNKTVITTNFASLTTAMTSLGSTDPTIQAQALTDINQLKDITNVNAVMEAMTNINNLLVGDPSVGYQSLISYHIQGAQLAIDSYWAAQTDAAFQVAGLSAPGAPFTHGQGNASQLPDPNSLSYPSGGTFEDCYQVVNGTPADVLSPLMTKSIVPCYQAMLRTQLQAYQFIFMSLAQTAESAQLATFNGYFTAELQAMSAYFAYFAGTGTDEGANYQTFMLQEVKSHGRKTMQPSDLTAFYPKDSSGDCPAKSWPYGNGWMSFDGANVNGGRIAYLNLTGQAPSLVTLSKFGEWTGCGHPPGYVKPFVFGWNWSGQNSVTLPAASAKAAPVVSPIAAGLLSGAPGITLPEEVGRAGA